jgi:hypothetical protein
VTPPGNTLEWEGQTILDRGGDKIGKIEEIFLVEETGRPEWALVKFGGLKKHATLVPLTQAQAVEKGVKVPYEKDAVSSAPEIEADAVPSEQQVTALYRHYGLETSVASDVQARNGSANGAPQHVHGSTDLRDEPIGDVLKHVSGDAQTLAAQELKLAKAEIAGKAKEVGIGAGIAGGAGYVGYLASLALMLCIIFALAEAMPGWLAALIVAVVLGAGAAVLAMKAKKRIQNAGPPIPEQTIESVKQTIETVKEEAKWGLGQTR